VRKDAGKTFHVIVRNLVGFLKSGVHEVFLFSHKRFSDAWNPAAVVLTLVATPKAATRWWCLFFCPGRCAELGAVRKHSFADCCLPYFPGLAGLAVTTPAAPGVVTIILVSSKVCFVVLDSNLLLVCMLQTDTKQHFFSSIAEGAIWRTAPAYTAAPFLRTVVDGRETLSAEVAAAAQIVVAAKIKFIHGVQFDVGNFSSAELVRLRAFMVR